MTDLETIAVYDNQIDSYVDFVKSETVDPTLLKFIDRIEPGGFVLDLGCGPATASSIMRDMGLRVDPVDASGEMVQLANKTHDIGARKIYFNEINSNEIYDGIWANFSLLHATAGDFSKILLALRRSMKPGGVFHLSMKTGIGATRDRLGRFYTYYSQADLSDCLLDAGFQVVEMETGEGRGLAGDIEPSVVITSVSSLDTVLPDQAEH